MQKKTMAVFGGTRGQGLSLVEAALAKGKFTPRVITRDPDGGQARMLAERGAQVVYGDLDQAGTLVKALAGADAAFINTFFWAHFSPAKEALHRSHMAWAADKAGVGHVVVSTLEDTRNFMRVADEKHWATPRGEKMPKLQGQYAVPHFDEKGATDCVFFDLGLNVTLLRTSFYFGNAISFGMGPKPVIDGTYALYLPMGEEAMAGISVKSIGKCAHAILESPEEYAGQTIGIAGEFLTGRQMAGVYSEVLDVDVKYVAMEPDDYRALGFPGAEDLGNMFQVYRDCAPGFLGNRSVTLSRRLNPELIDFRGWATKYRDQLLATMTPASSVQD